MPNLRALFDKRKAEREAGIQHSQAVIEAGERQEDAVAQAVTQSRDLIASQEPGTGESVVAGLGRASQALASLPVQAGKFVGENAGELIRLMAPTAAPIGPVTAPIAHELDAVAAEVAPAVDLAAKPLANLADQQLALQKDMPSQALMAAGMADGFEEADQVREVADRNSVAITVPGTSIRVTPADVMEGGASLVPQLPAAAAGGLPAVILTAMGQSGLGKYAERRDAGESIDAAGEDAAKSAAITGAITALMPGGVEKSLAAMGAGKWGPGTVANFLKSIGTEAFEEGADETLQGAIVDGTPVGEALEQGGAAAIIGGILGGGTNIPGMVRTPEQNIDRLMERGPMDMPQEPVPPQEITAEQQAFEDLNARLVELNEARAAAAQPQSEAHPAPGRIDARDLGELVRQLSDEQVRRSVVEPESAAETPPPEPVAAETDLPPDTPLDTQPEPEPTGFQVGDRVRITKGKRKGQTAEVVDVTEDGRPIVKSDETGRRWGGKSGLTPTNLEKMTEAAAAEGAGDGAALPDQAPASDEATGGDFMPPAEDPAVEGQQAIQLDEARAVEPGPVVEDVSEGQPEWREFSPETGSLGIPRAEMPQIKSEDRGALANFLRARGIEFERTEALPTELKPTQAEFSPKKVQKAREYEGTERAILVSQDGHVIDGHHQWMRNLVDSRTEPMPIIRLGGGVDQVLEQVREFPSSEQDGGATAPTTNEVVEDINPVVDQPVAAEPEPVAAEPAAETAPEPATAEPETVPEPPKTDPEPIEMQGRQTVRQALEQLPEGERGKPVVASRKIRVLAPNSMDTITDDAAVIEPLTGLAFVRGGIKATPDQVAGVRDALPAPASVDGTVTVQSENGPAEIEAKQAIGYLRTRITQLSNLLECLRS